MSSDRGKVLEGACFCRATAFGSTTLPTGITYCHCQTCRKLSGAPFLAFATFQTSSLTWLAGSSSMRKTRYSDIAERANCGECGGPLYMQYDHEPDRLYVVVGAIDEETVQGELPRAELHIFVAEKSRWYDMPGDSLPKYEGFTPGFRRQIDAYRLSRDQVHGSVAEDTDR